MAIFSDKFFDLALTKENTFFLRRKIDDSLRIEYGNWFVDDNDNLVLEFRYIYEFQKKGNKLFGKRYQIVLEIMNLDPQKIKSTHPCIEITQTKIVVRTNVNIVVQQWNALFTTREQLSKFFGLEHASLKYVEKRDTFF